MNKMKQYFKEVQVSNEEHGDVLPVDETQVINEVTPTEVAPTVVSMDHYEPLTQEQVSEFIAKQPNPETKLSLDVIKARIANVEFISSERSISCTITLDNGFKVDGTAFVADPANYIEELGRHYAYDKAFEKLIPIAIFLWMESKKQPVVSTEKEDDETTPIEETGISDK